MEHKLLWFLAAAHKFIYEQMEKFIIWLESATGGKMGNTVLFHWIDYLKSILKSAIVSFALLVFFLMLSLSLILSFKFSGNACAADMGNHPFLLMHGVTQTDRIANFAWIRSQMQTGGMYENIYRQVLANESNSLAQRLGGEYMIKMLKAIADDAVRAALIIEAKQAASSGDYYIEGFRVMWILAMFDWFRDQWNDAEAQQLIDYMEEIVTRNQWTTKSVMNNHFHEDHAMHRILPGLVLRHEGLDPETETWLWERSRYWMNEELVKSFNEFSGSFGADTEGNSYWARGHTFLVTTAMAWMSCTGENLFETWTMAQFPKAALYMWRPSDGSLFHWGDHEINLGTYNETDPITRYGGAYRTKFSFFLPLMRWGASAEAAFIYKEMIGIPDNLAGENVGTYVDVFPRFLFFDIFGPRHDPAPVDITTLPKSVLLDGYNGVVIRSGWDAKDVVFGYKQNRYTQGHDHMDAGSFVISREIDLAEDAGYYSSNGDHLDEHTQYFYPRTIAHNTITVQKPGQTTHVQWWTSITDTPNDDGGQSGLGSPGPYDPPFNYSDYSEDQYDRGRINRYEYDQTNGYTYFTGDVTPAYFSDSVSNFTRSVFSPDGRHFILLDRVSSIDASYPKRWLMHTENELHPVDGGVLEPQDAAGAIRYSGQEFYTQNGNDRLFVKMLLPANDTDNTLIFRGGPGYEYWYGYDETGFNADQCFDDPDSSETPGAWRVEQMISNETDSIFLNVLYATDTATQGLDDVTLLDSTQNILAVQVTSNACLFSKSEVKDGVFLATGTFTVPSQSGVSNCILTDLAADTIYKIYDGCTIVHTLTSSAQGIIRFANNDASEHIYQIVKQDSSGDLNNDGRVNLNDFYILRAHLYQPSNLCPECDIDGDGAITFGDARKLIIQCDCPRCTYTCN